VRLRWIVAPFVILLSVISIPCGAYASSDQCANCGPGSVTPDPGGIDVHEGDDGSTPAIPGIPSTPGGANGPNYEREYTPACAENRTLSATEGFANTLDCPGAHQCPDAADIEMFIARRTVDGATRGPWTYVGSACLGPQQLLAYDPAAAAAFALDYFKHLPLPEPGVHVQPAGRALVNLPTIIYADSPPTGRWSVDHAPFPTITITGTPHWQIEADGTSITSDTPGRAYDGIDPRSNPSHYLTHTFTEPTSATTISVTVTWSATFTLGDDPTPILMNGTVSRTSTIDIAVDEAGSVLTDNS
jgi:hypothetical protein